MATSAGTLWLDVMPDFSKFGSELRGSMRDVERALGKVEDAVARDIEKPFDDASAAVKDMSRDSVRALGDVEGAVGGIKAEAGQTESSIGQVADAFDQIVKKAASAEGAVREIKSEVSKLDGMKADVPVGVDSSKVGAGVKDATVKVEQGMSSWMKGGLVTLGIGLGVALIAPVMKVLGDAGQWDTAFARMRAILGSKGREVADQAGRVAGHVYAQGWGATIGEVGDVTAKVIRDLPKAAVGKGEFGLLQLAGFDPDKDAEAIETATSQIFAISDLLGEDASRVTAAARQLITTGLADDWDEALDIIGAAARDVNDPLNELIDTFLEYPTQFRKIGLSGEQVINILDQMVEAGAPSLDKAADALKEFSIRVVDDSKTTNAALAELGLAPDKIAEDFAAGGPRAESAFASVITQIQEVARTSPLAAEQLGVALFGTQWEDLGGAILAIDPAKTKIAADGVADDITTALGSSLSAQWTTLKRTVQTSIANALAGIKITFTNIDGKPATQGLLEALGTILGTVTGVFNKTIAPEAGGKMVAGILTSILNYISSLFGGGKSKNTTAAASDFGTFFKTVWNDPKLKAAFMELKDKLIEWFNKEVKPKVVSTATEVGNAIGQALVNGVINAVKGMSWRALLRNSGVPGLIIDEILPGMIAPPGMPALAAGGVVTRPTIALVGESGPEAVVPLDRVNAMSGTGAERPIFIVVKIGDQPINDLIEEVTRREGDALSRMLVGGRRI